MAVQVQYTYKYMKNVMFLIMGIFGAGGKEFLTFKMGIPGGHVCN